MIDNQRELYEGIAARYRRFRPIRLRLNNELVSRLSRDALDEGARKLGLVRDGMFVFENEDETSVLMDYCIFDVRHKGRNAVEQYLADSPPDPDSDEMICLRAMQQATYALVVVLRVEPGIGCHVRNLFTEETRLLADFGFAETARPGLVLATRLLDFSDYVATGGAPLPAGILDEDKLGEWQRRFSATPNDDRVDPAAMIRACLQKGASSSVRYEAPHGYRRSDAAGEFMPPRTSGRRRRAAAKLQSQTAVANRRCPCGSGKMFKNCCGKRQSQS